MPDRLDSLKKLRSWRVFNDRDVSITKQVAAAMRDAAAAQKHLDRAVSAWEASAPVELRRLCEVRSAKGVLTVKVAGASARFQVDRWLRGGGEAALRSGGVTRVRVV